MKSNHTLILNLEDGQINKVIQWGKGRSGNETPIVQVDEYTVKGVQSYMPWLENMPLIIEKPEDYILVYKLMKKEGLVTPVSVNKVNKKYCNKKYYHPLSIFNNKEWLWDIANTWRPEHKRGMLLAGGIGGYYTHCWHSIYSGVNCITLNDGDDWYMNFKGNIDDINAMWELLKVGVPFSYHRLQKLGFKLD